MLELRIIEGKRSLPIFDLPAMHGRAAAVREVGDTIEGLIAFLDELSGDPDTEPNGDELDGNASEDDFMHHHSLGRDRVGPGCPIADPDCCPARDDDMTYGASDGLPGEPDDAEKDDEDTGIEDTPGGFDPESDMCLAGDDRVESGSCTGAMLICEDKGPGDVDDAEHDLATHNVPCDKVFSLDYNIFTDKRAALGRSNLLTSFRTIGGVEFSADYLGATHRLRCDAPVKAGDAVCSR